MNLHAYIIKTSGTDRETARKLGLLLAHSFFSGIFVSLYFSTANSEFLNNFGSEFLPAAYLASGLISYFSVRIYSKKLKKKPGYRTLAAALLLLLSITLLLRLAFYIPAKTISQAVSLCVFLMARTFVSVSGLEQTTVISKSFNLKDSKKYSGLVGSGAIVSSIIGFISIPLLMPLMHSRLDFLYFAAAGMALSVMFLTKINKETELGDAANNHRTKAGEEQGLSSLFKNKFIKYLAFCSGISMMALCFIDYSFAVSAKKLFATPEELSSFVGAFLCAVKSGAFVFSIFSGRLFRLFGLKLGVLLLPAIYTMLTAALVVISFNESNSLLVFSLVLMALRMLSQIFRESIEDPVIKILYQFISPHERAMVQAKIEGATKQLFIVAAGLILLISEFLFKQSLSTNIHMLVLPVYVFWWISATGLTNAMKEKLKHMLTGNETVTGKDSILDSIKRYYFSNKPRDLVDAVFPERQKAAQPLLNPVAANHSHAFVPHSNLSYLKHSPGHSRFEMRIHQPIVILPPGLSKWPKENTQPGNNEDQELMALTTGEKIASPQSAEMLHRVLSNSRRGDKKMLALNLLINNQSLTAARHPLYYINFPDPDVQQMSLMTLEASNYKIQNNEWGLFYQTIDKIIADLAWIFSISCAIPGQTEYKDLISAIEEDEMELKQQLLSVLSWKYERAVVEALRKTLASGNSDFNSRLVALELLDHILDNTIKRKILPVFEIMPQAARVQALAQWFFYPRVSFNEALVAIVQQNYNRHGVWSRACALKIIGQMPEGEMQLQVQGAIFHPHPLLKQLSREILKQNAPQLYQKLLPDNYHNAKALTQPDNESSDAIFKRMTLFKHLPIFNKATFNQLVVPVLNARQQNFSGRSALIEFGNKTDDVLILTQGRMIMEYKGKFPVGLGQQSVLLPQHFSGNSIKEIIGDNSAQYLRLPRKSFRQLLFTSQPVYAELKKLGELE